MFTSSDSSGASTPSDRVRHSTSERLNREIDARTDANIACFQALDDPAIRRRISELDGGSAGSASASGYAGLAGTAQRQGIRHRRP